MWRFSERSEVKCVIVANSINTVLNVIAPFMNVCLCINGLYMLAVANKEVVSEMPRSSPVNYRQHLDYFAPVILIMRPNESRDSIRSDVYRTEPK